MVTALLKLIRGTRRAVACDGHHYHFRSPYSDPIGITGRTRWACCRCDSTLPATGPAPTSDGPCECRPTGEDTVTAWLDRPTGGRPTPNLPALRRSA